MQISKNQSLKKKAKPNSFIDMEDHHTLIENDHLNNNVLAISNG